MFHVTSSFPRVLGNMRAFWPSWVLVWNHPVGLSFCQLVGLNFSGSISRYKAMSSTAPRLNPKVIHPNILSLMLASRDILRNKEVQEGHVVLSITGVFIVNILYSLRRIHYWHSLDHPMGATNASRVLQIGFLSAPTLEACALHYSWDHCAVYSSFWLRNPGSTDVVVFYYRYKNMFLVHQITFQCSARPNIDVTNDQVSLVPKNACSLPGEKLVGWLFKISCQYEHEKKNSKVENKELLLDVGSASAPWKGNRRSLPACDQGLVAL